MAIRNKLVKLSNIGFRGHLMHQRKTQQSIFDHVKDFLGYQKEIRTRIINGKILGRKQWEPYYLYLTYLNFWRKNLDGIIKSL